MSMRFSGEFITLRSPEGLFDFLSDPNRFGPLLPGFQGLTLQDATHFTVKANVGFAHVQGVAEIRMELSEAVRAQRVLYKGQGTVAGSQIAWQAGFDLLSLGTSTRVAWRAEASIFGKLAFMAGGMFEPLAQENISKLMDGLKNALGEMPAASAGESPGPEDRPTAQSVPAEIPRAELGAASADVPASQGNLESPPEAQPFPITGDPERTGGGG